MITNITTFIEKMEWIIYLSQNIGNSCLYIDIPPLLYHDFDLQQTMAYKTEYFLGKLAHMVIVEMIKHLKH